MGQRRTYFMLNKEQDFRRCYLSNMEYRDGRLCTRTVDGQGAETAVLISRVFDSRETDMYWHRLCIYDVQREEQAQFTLKFYTANELVRTDEQGEMIYVPDAFYSEEYTLEEKLRKMQPYLVKQVEDQEDVLLHDIKGRYLWMVLMAPVRLHQSISFGDFQLFFPRESFLRYLPEIYQREDKKQFFERFLAVFQTAYEDLNERIYRVPEYLDAHGTDRKFLEWLTRWIGIADTYMWNEEQLRRLLEHAVSLYKLRGTRKAVCEYVKLYTGGYEPLIVENFELKEGDGRYHAGNLFQDDAYRFYVLIQEEHVPTARDYQALVKVIEQVRPANMELELIVLKPYIFMDGHSYLGVNSVLGEYRDFSLDGASMLSFAVLPETANRDEFFEP